MMNKFPAYFISFMMMFILPKSGLAQLVGDWKIAAKIPDANGMKTSLGLAGPVAGIHDRKLIIAGGANFPESMPWEGGRKMYYRKIFVFDRTEKDEYVLKRTSDLPYTLAYPAVASCEKGIVVCGGENENGISTKCFLLVWDELQQDIRINELPDLPVALANSSAVIIGSVIYLTGGEGKDFVSDALYTLPLNNTGHGWISKAKLPHTLSHSVVIYNKENNAIFLIGGRSKNANGISDLYDDVFMYKVSADQWVKKSSLPYPLSAGTGIDAGNGQLLVFGGDKGMAFHETEKLLKEIRETTDQDMVRRLNQRKAEGQSSHPGFSREILRYDIKKDIWAVESIFPFQTPVTTTALVEHNRVILPSGEIRAGVRTPEIYTGKLKYRLAGTKR